MNFNNQDKCMLDSIIQNPNDYKIYVDNDCISVCKVDDENFNYDFSEYGYYFALQLLRYLGIDADMV